MAKKIEQILKEDLALDHETSSLITEAWEAKVSEVREEVAAELREEFSKKFEHDKSVLVEAMDRFLNDKIQSEIEELSQDRKALVAEQVKYKKLVREHTEKLNEFVTMSLAKEVKELREERTDRASKVKMLEEMVERKLTDELSEIANDKRMLAEQHVKIIAEGKQALNETKDLFIKNAARVIEENIDRILTKELTQYRKDIKLARENDFGRRIFEAYAAEYMVSYLNENVQIKKMDSKLNELKQILESKEQELKTQKSLVEEANKQLKTTKDIMERKTVMAEILAPLAGEKRKIMSELLESVETKNLRTAFNKYIPAVLSESISEKQGKKELLAEGTVVKTGDRALAQVNATSLDSELDGLKKLAGMQ